MRRGQFVPRTPHALRISYDEVDAKMLRLLWNASAGYFQNKRSADLAPIVASSGWAAKAALRALHGVQGAPELYDTDPILQASVPKRTLDELFQEADNVHR